MDAHVAALGSDFAPHVVDQGVHLAGQQPEVAVLRAGIAVLQPHAQAPFGIDANQQGHPAERLETTDEWQRLVGPAHKETDSSHLGLAQQVLEILQPLTLKVQRHADYHQLCNLLLQGHVPHRCVNPGSGHAGAGASHLGRYCASLAGRTLHSAHLPLGCTHAYQHCNTHQYKDFPHHIVTKYFAAKIHQKSDIANFLLLARLTVPLSSPLVRSL